MATAVESKAQTIAQFIDGNVVDDSDRVAVCIKGIVNGFPATLEAMYASWPFGISYTIETNVVVDPGEQRGASRGGTITVYPRFGRGISSIFTKLLLFEGSGSPVGDRRLEKVFNFSYDDRQMAERFIHYPAVSEYLFNLERLGKFSELIIRPEAGIYLAVPTNFKALEYENCRKTFELLGFMAKALFEAFPS